ncbi:hypothetical protein Emin_0293 [Elusimicrobium minutum Pei191]|uniref:Uncharacterized protein n=1 Tax=Elusimicrobium minutum (strain Pei191) TaxID=445932 RepID=B2KBU9_ELUMP|nr:hypothetical protein [Elusimicrobium minutum]ACC97853.1 hypothetical protein Emin_0293 [Elusimicrobium minutum Pei191]
MRLRIKKRKVLFFVAGLAAAGFLLLPVIDKAFSKTIPGSLKKAQPQVASSNPLARAMEFLSSFIDFGNTKKDKQPVVSSPSVNSQKLSNSQKFALGLASIDTNAQRAAMYDGNMPDYADRNIKINFEDYGSAEVKDKDGNWVLVQQKEPDVFSRGMYESDLKKDPLSLIEGRNISDKIAQDNKDKEGLYASALPFSKIFADGAKKGMSAIAKTFDGSSGAMLASSGHGTRPSGYPTVSGSGGLSGFSNAGSGANLSAAGQMGLPSLEKLFADISEKASSSNDRYDSNGRKLSDKEREETKTAERDADYERRRGEAFRLAEAKAIQMLEESAKGQKEVELSEKDITRNAACEEVCYVDSYHPNKDAVQAVQKESVINILNSVLPDFREGLKKGNPAYQQYLNDYITETEKDSSPKGMQPKYVYVLKSSKEDAAGTAEVLEKTGRGIRTDSAFDINAGRQQVEKEIASCTEEECFWVPKVEGYFKDASIAAGGKMRELNVKGSENDEKGYHFLTRSQLQQIVDSDRNTVYVTGSPVTSLSLHKNLNVYALQTFPLDTKYLTGQQKGEEISGVSGEINKKTVEKIELMENEFTSAERQRVQSAIIGLMQQGEKKQNGSTNKK